MKKSCESCEWWKQGDLAGRINNAGMCIHLMNTSEDFYGHEEHIPYWAEGLSKLTVSWEGKSCPVFLSKGK